ncbi:MAG TPA: DUF2911 domain-containing protein [Cyclobacteriaceae bacterium]|jgi:hypothetical protein|nr:DUF2911 domain-containing protein [Cyclobacteriaceae bacterium]
MKKVLIIGGVAIVILAGGLLYYTQVYTKSFSPSATVDFKDENLKVQVIYSRPFKKSREIFGKLVPYGKTWRTGANEPTTFETNSDLKFGDKVLKAGKYSLWAVPNPETWQIAFNSEIPSWGINFDGTAQRNPATDAVVLETPVVAQDKVFEQFTISVEKVGEGAELILIWDKTLVAVPFSAK